MVTEAQIDDIAEEERAALFELILEEVPVGFAFMAMLLHGESRRLRPEDLTLLTFYKFSESEPVAFNATSVVPYTDHRLLAKVSFASVQTIDLQGDSMLILADAWDLTRKVSSLADVAVCAELRSGQGGLQPIRSHRRDQFHSKIWTSIDVDGHLKEVDVVDLNNQVVKQPVVHFGLHRVRRYSAVIGDLVIRFDE